MAKDDNRYEIATKSESSLPFDLFGIGDTIHTTTILDKQTGEMTQGCGWTAEEAKAKAFDKLSEK